MEPRTYFDNYVAKHGAMAAVAERLGVPYPTLAAVCNGQRGIGHKLAQRMAEADPSLDASVLVWVRPLRDVAAEKKKAA
jgi:plasmid maintenance system antidote protein VapI